MNAATIDAYDVVVIGGGAAGLNGALLLARSRRSVVVVDSGRPRNAPAQGVHGLLGHDGVPPAELLERGRAEVRRYGGEVVTGEVDNVRRDEGRFVVSLTDGRNVSARRILVTTGLVDELPPIRDCANGGDATCCIVRTATDGRCATRRSACSRTDPARCTRPCSSVS